MIQCIGSRSEWIHIIGPDPLQETGNVDPDPVSKKNRDKLKYKSTKIIRI